MLIAYVFDLIHEPDENSDEIWRRHVQTGDQSADFVAWSIDLVFMSPIKTPKDIQLTIIYAKENHKNSPAQTQYYIGPIMKGEERGKKGPCGNKELPDSSESDAANTTYSLCGSGGLNRRSVNQPQPGRKAARGRRVLSINTLTKVRAGLRGCPQECIDTFPHMRVHVCI